MTLNLEKRDGTVEPSFPLEVCKRVLWNTLSHNSFKEFFAKFIRQFMFNKIIIMPQLYHWYIDSSYISLQHHASLHDRQHQMFLTSLTIN